MGNLDADIRRAEEMGYGPSYGKYKADYPGMVIPKELPKSENKLSVCICCGKEFLPHRKGVKYCGCLCRDRYNHNKRNKRLREERNAQTLAEQIRLS